MSTEEEKEITVWELGALRSIEFEAATFPLDVRTVEKGETPRIEMRNRGKQPNVAIEHAGDHVNVRIDWDDEDSIFGWFRRPARMTLFLPAKVRGRVAIGAGNIRILGELECEELAFETGAGSIHAQRVRGRMRFDTGAGSIQIEDLEGAVVARTNAGSIRVRVRHLDPGTHTVHSEAGSVRVDVAQGLPVHVIPQVAFGHVKVEIREVPDAAAHLEVGSSAGAVAVRPWPGMKASAHVDFGPYRTSSLQTVKKQPSGELERILEMVADGTLTPDQAGELIAALNS